MYISIVLCLVQDPVHFMSLIRGGNDIVCFCKVIGSSDHSRMPMSISGELFGLRVKKIYKIKFAKKSEKITNYKLYNFLVVFEVKESNEIVILVTRGQLWP